MKVYEFEQHDMQGNPNPDWLAVRAGKFTGSDFSVMLKKGITRDKMILQKATEHILKRPCSVDRYVSADMLRGIELEPQVREIYKFISGNEVKEVGFIERDEFSGVSPDGLIGEDGLLEIKCPKDIIFVEQCVYDTIKPEYYTQIQYALYITGRIWCDYIAYNESFEPFIKRFERDEEHIKEIETALEYGIEQTKKIITEFRNKREENGASVENS